MIPNEPAVLANSLWTATANPAPDTPPLAGVEEADVAIVGAGVTGLSAALHLAERGLRVVVLEAQAIGWGASGRNGGQVNPGLKHDPDQLLAAFGADMGGRMLRLSGEAPALVMDLVRRHGIDCDAVQAGWLQPAHNAKALRLLEARARQWQARGVDLQILSRAEIRDRIGTEVYLGGLFDPRGAGLHPLNFTLGLARAAQAAGAVIHGQSPVTSMMEKGNIHVLHCPGGQVTAARVLLCTNGYSDDLRPPLARTLVPVRSVQVASAPLPEAVRRTILPGGQTASDSRRVMVYYKIDGAGRFVIGGRGDYNDGTTAKLQENLRRIAGEMFPQIGAVPFEHAWGGFVAMTASHLPHLTPLGAGVMSATGYNGRGLALGTAMGRVLADWATGKPEEDLDFPVSAPRPIPFHRLRKVAVRGAVMLFRAQDALGI
ncbi:MAG: NAD(P)/FAD-dependent oxidoreductase [Paenirhodobacter sp.]|uniref:NAD(P)/FAD-dependent oxidoreductase n=1 Tax=Paenirhodobacter sp. TaxID=1965326 RepID=UPI003D125F91